MLTVKQRLISGHESVVETKRVSYQPETTDGQGGTSLPALFIENEDGGTTMHTSGWYYVMNDAGNTVSRYFLGNESELKERASAPRITLTEDQIKHMVNRFLSWKLPETFNPDGGISFKKTFNEHTANPMKHEPSGTNLFDAQQADLMVRYMIEAMPPSSSV